MAKFRYDPPAAQNDFAGNPKEDELLQKWSNLIKDYFQGEIKNLRTILGQESLFFSEIDRVLDNSVPTAPVPWNGFPRNIWLRVNKDRAKQFQEVEIRGQAPIGFTDRKLSQSIKQPYRQQDEYLEWVPIKKSGRVVKYAFTAEGPEYWEFLAENDRNKLLALYKEFTGRNVDWTEISWNKNVWGQNRLGKPVKIYKIGDYNPYNAVNLEECAAHLTHPANTLGAEIDLAAKATVQRADRSGNLVSERRRLACCSDFGDPNRNSDPEIGRQVNLSVRGGISLTLANPVGLYIQRFDNNRVADKDGNAIPDWWKIIRGKDGRVLRAEFGPPETSQLTLDDVRVGSANEPLTSGGQLAELITMVIYARTVNMGVSEPPISSCVNRCCVKKGNAADGSLLDQVEINDPCSADGWVNAFPELGQPQPISPFDRRLMGRGRME
jgi:hypothetical protein